MIVGTLFEMKTNRLSWDDLKVFLAVARLGNLSKAGRALGIDHATVGRRISALEFALETPVFESDRAGYRLNAQGRDMLAHVEAVEASVLTMGDTLEGNDPDPTGSVRVATMEGIATLYLSEQFADLKRHQPDITIELVTSSFDVRVSQREADLFIGFFEPRGANIQMERIGEFPLYLYAHPSYLAEHGEPTNVEDLKRHRFATYVPDMIRLDAVRWLDEVVAEPIVAFRSSSMLSQMFAAASGVGIVMLPSFAHAERFGLREILVGKVDVRRSVWLSSHLYLRRVPRIRRVAAFLAEAVSRDYPVSRDDGPAAS
jgi:DNA-binding transcriptional LysR family regulator